ncbi:MAG: L-rhamnose mutarotase [Acidimicrobiales bacterium]|jgi:L-rhamnose mutarotase
MQRICFHLRVDPDRLAEYRQRHASVWPEMRNALSAAGWHNYSLFLDKTGLLTGYFECENLVQAQRAMESTSVNERWQAEMAEYFVELGGGPPDRAIVPIPEIFHLD